MTPPEGTDGEGIDATTTEALGKLGVATLHEALGQCGLMDPSFRPIMDGVSIAGRAVTALCKPGDNLMVHVAVEVCGTGDVLVVACEDSSAAGVVGELLATSLRSRGVVGCVLEQGVRDVAALRRMRFPVWAPRITARGTTKQGAGSVQAPVSCGGVLVRPGDVVVADDDGVLVVPASRAREAVWTGRDRVRREEAVRSRLEAGELGVDIYGLRPLVAKLGVGPQEVAGGPLLDDGDAREDLAEDLPRSVG